MTQRPNGQTGGQASGPAGRAAPSSADAWQDWVTIWESEFSALAADPEAQLVWARLVALWAAQARAAAAFIPDGPAGRAGAEPSPRPAPADAAPDASDTKQQQFAIERLAQRVEELEQRLAKLGDWTVKGGRPA